MSNRRSSSTTTSSRAAFGRSRRYVGKLGFDLVARHGRIGVSSRRTSRVSHGRSSPRSANDVVGGDTVVRFVRGGPQGRPELFGELSA
jgi:hypothetical protein